MHLSHPMLQRALSALTRRRFPGTGEEVSRWTVRLGEVPPGAEALVLAQRRGAGRQRPARDLPPLGPHAALSRPEGRPRRAARPPARPWSCAAPPPSSDDSLCTRARDLLDEVAPDLKRFLADYAAKLTTTLKSATGDRRRPGPHARRRSATAAARARFRP